VGAAIPLTGEKLARRVTAFRMGAFQMKALTFQTSAALLLCGVSWAQSPTSQATKPAKPTSEISPPAEAWATEQQSRIARQEELRRELSDPSGRLRPDLFMQGLEQMKQMKVVSHIGPVSEESPKK
jgi:hypothetical protein